MRNHQEFVELVDRYRLGQARRLAIGVSLPEDCRCLRTALVLTEGRGKCLRVLWIEHRETEIQTALATACNGLREADAPELGDLVRLRHDLSTAMSGAIREAMALSGNNEKRLLVAAIDDPGVWVRDFDEARFWLPMVAPALLAGQTGLPIVDALPAQDLVNGGHGWPLPPLAWWLMFADRNRRVAETPRVIIRWAESCQFAWLPESDGLDNELPAIRFQSLPGGSFEQQLLSQAGGPDLSPEQRDRLGASGKLIPPLLEFWQAAARRQRFHPADRAGQRELVRQTIEQCRRGRIPRQDLLHSHACFVASQLQQFVASGPPGRAPQLVAAGSLDRHGLLQSEIGRQTGLDWWADPEFNFTPASLDAVAAAVAGLLHVDQMAISIPWLTGCSLPRVAGRLTPGNLASFRRLVMEMGDTQPPLMKLRDAV